MTWSDANGEFISPFDEPGNPSKDSNGRLTGRYQLDLLAGATGVSVGAEALRESATSTFIVDEASSMLPVRRNDIGLFAEARPAFGDRLFTTIGLRVERLDRSALAAGSFRPAFEPSIVWSANPKGSVAWIARPASSAGAALGSTTLRASAGTGIKPPTAFDIAFTDNPDLKPERSRSVDVGVEQSLFASRAIVDATWFYNSYDDLIVSISQPLSGASRYQTDNIANAKSSGLELGAAWRLSPAVTARASWTWLDTEVLGVDSLPGIGFSVYAVGDALVRRPRHAGTLDVNWRTDRASAFAIVSVRGAMRDLEPNWASSVYTNPRRVTTTIGAALRLAPALELYGRVLNAFDSDYEDVLGFPAPGRSAMIGLRVTAGH
jgi:outer membrane receptor protein involved in Fe transport